MEIDSAPKMPNLILWKVLYRFNHVQYCFSKPKMLLEDIVTKPFWNDCNQLCEIPTASLKLYVPKPMPNL